MEQWKVLLFKDLFHYGGIQRDQKEGMDATALPEGEGSERESFRCSWTSAGTSPKSIQRLWLKMVSAFISLDTSGMHEDRSIPWNDGISKSVSRADTHTDAERIPTEDEVWENTVNQFLTGVAFHSCLEVLSREFPGALRTETAIQQHEQASASFQNKSDVESSNAFLSSLFEMLRLERKAKLAVEDFCTKMSRVFHVDETGSKIVVSDDPTSTLVDVACEACGHVRSIDLDRDPDVSRGQWRCIVPDCMSKYDMRLIERKACKQLEKNVCAYSIQDVRCTSCDQVSCGRLDRQCPCGGVLDVHHKPNGLVSTIQRMMQRSIRHDLLYARSSSERIDAHAFHGVESENDLHETWMERILDAF